MFVTPKTRSRSGVDCCFVTRIVFVHGSVGNAEATFGKQRELAERFDVLFHTRSGYPPRPPEERIDFEEQADELAGELRDGDHLVGHSYGGVVSLLAAAHTDARLASLAVSEPPAFGVARGDPAVEEFLGKIIPFAATNPTPEEYAAFFLPLVGSAMPPGQLSPTIEAGLRAALVERPPNEAEIPFDVLAAKPFPKLVFTGAHHPAFDAVVDVLVERLPAERAVAAGAGHSIPRAPGYNEQLVAFVERAS
jgi:pimeloyl-ACP methyl ester carboxylesterase